MSSEKVHLFDLRERTSAIGNRYLSGWLGKASVVAFLDREAEEPTWQVFVSPLAQRPTGSTSQGQAGSTNRPYPVHPSAVRSRSGGNQPIPPGELDDDVSDL